MPSQPPVSWRAFSSSPRRAFMSSWRSPGAFASGNRSGCLPASCFCLPKAVRSQPCLCFGRRFNRKLVLSDPCGVRVLRAFVEAHREVRAESLFAAGSYTNFARSFALAIRVLREILRGPPRSAMERQRPRWSRAFLVYLWGVLSMAAQPPARADVLWAVRVVVWMLDERLLAGRAGSAGWPLD